MKLTQSIVDNAPPKQREYRLTDTGGTNLSLRVYPSSRKSYFFRYSAPDGKYRDAKIGDPTMIKLKDARKICLKHQLDIANGEGLGSDPGDAKEDLLFEDAVVEFSASLQFRNYAESTQKWINSVCSNQLVPKFAGRKIRSIKRAEFKAFLDGLVFEGSGDATARSARNVLRMIYSWAEEFELIELNVMRQVKHSGKARLRDRVLSNREIANFCQIMLSGRHSAEVANCALFVLFNAQRIGETIKMQIEEIDLENRCWIIPQKNSKNRKEHHIPLSEMSVSLLRRAMGKRTSGPVFRIHERTVSNTLARYEKDDRFDGRFTAHDLRRTFATRIFSVVPSADENHVRRVLNHEHKSDGALKNYNHHEYMEQKRHLLKAWSDHIERLIQDTGEFRGSGTFEGEVQ